MDEIKFNKEEQERLSELGRRFYENPTVDTALELAKLYGLEYEVQYQLSLGDTPEETLKEWDLL